MPATCPPPFLFLFIAPLPFSPIRLVKVACPPRTLPAIKTRENGVRRPGSKMADFSITRVKFHSSFIGEFEPHYLVLYFFICFLPAFWYRRGNNNKVFLTKRKKHLLYGRKDEGRRRETNTGDHTTGLHNGSAMRVVVETNKKDFEERGVRIDFCSFSHSLALVTGRCATRPSAPQRC